MKGSYRKERLRSARQQSTILSGSRTKTKRKGWTLSGPCFLQSQDRLSLVYTIQSLQAARFTKRRLRRNNAIRCFTSWPTTKEKKRKTASQRYKIQETWNSQGHDSPKSWSDNKAKAMQRHGLPAIFRKPAGLFNIELLVLAWQNRRSNNPDKPEESISKNVQGVRELLLFRMAKAYWILHKDKESNNIRPCS